MPETQREVAERLRHSAEIRERAGDDRGAREARTAADRAERAATHERAIEIEREFSRGGGGGRGPG